MKGAFISVAVIIMAGVLSRLISYVAKKRYEKPFPTILWISPLLIVLLYVVIIGTASLLLIFLLFAKFNLILTIALLSITVIAILFAWLNEKVTIELHPHKLVYRQFSQITEFEYTNLVGITRFFRFNILKIELDLGKKIYVPEFNSVTCMLIRRHRNSLTMKKQF